MTPTKEIIECSKLNIGKADNTIRIRIRWSGAEYILLLDTEVRDESARTPVFVELQKDGIYSVVIRTEWYADGGFYIDLDASILQHTILFFNGTKLGKPERALSFLGSKRRLLINGCFSLWITATIDGVLIPLRYYVLKKQTKQIKVIDAFRFTKLTDGRFEVTKMKETAK